MIDETGKVTFNEQEQQEVNRIIGERLSREGIQDKNEIVETLKEFGYEGTPAEIKQAIKEQAEYNRTQTAEAQKQADLDALKEQARNEGTSPELLKEIRELKADLADIKGERTAIKQAAEQKTAAETIFNKQVGFFQEHEETKGIDLEKLNNNPKFVKFLQKQRPTGKEDFLVEVYKDFAELVGGAEAEAIAKIQANVDRSTGSGRGKGDPTGGSYGLTENQRNLADENGMTYKQYSENLSLVKRKG